MSGKRSDASAARACTAAAVTGLLASCTSTGHAGRQVPYLCDDGMRVTMNFRGDAALLSGLGSEPIRLTRRGREFAYESPVRTVRLQGEILTITVGRMTPITCRERR